VSVSDVSKFISGLIAMVMILSAGISRAGDGLRIEPDQLKTKVGQPGVVILDARIVPDWRNSDLKIVGAMRIDPHNVSAWAANYPKDGFIVVYCS
jgi:hypothetical protein